MMETEDRPRVYNLDKQIILVDARCDSMTITWPKENHAVAYILEYRKVNPEKEKHGLNNADELFERLSDSITGTSSRKRNLFEESEYVFRVAPIYNSDKLGEWITHPEAFETLSREQDEDFAMAPPIVTLPPQYESLLITWEEVDEEIYGFELQMRENKGGAKWFGFQTDVTSEVKKKNLTSKLGYQFRVRPVTDYEEPFSPPSEPVVPRRENVNDFSAAAYQNTTPQQSPRQQAKPKFGEKGSTTYSPATSPRPSKSGVRRPFEYQPPQSPANKEKHYGDDCEMPREQQYGYQDPDALPAPWFKTAGPNTVLICWQEQADAGGYELQMKELRSKSEAWVTIAANLSGCQVKKKNLTSQYGYQFRVRPVGASRNYNFSNPSNPVVLPTVRRTTASRQTKKATNQGSMPAPWFKGANEKHAIIVCWQPQANTSGYELQMREVAQGEVWSTIASRLTGTEVKKKNLSSANGYQFRVRPVDGPKSNKGFSGPSSTAIAQ